MAPSLSVEESQLSVLVDQDVQYSREERTSQRENSAVCRESHLSTKQSTHQLIWVLSKAGERAILAFERTVFIGHTGPGILPAPISYTDKPQSSEDI